jgi:hypothetical protein
MKYKALITFLLLSHFIQAQNKAVSVKLISATVRDWMTGAAPGRTGTTYTLKLEILAVKPVEFKNLWLGKELKDFEVQTFFTDPNKKPARGDSVLLVYTRVDKKPEPEKVLLPVPFEYKGEALLEYYVAGRPRYLTIKKFEKLRTIKGM